jgi:hypothetical protein
MMIEITYTGGGVRSQGGNGQRSGSPWYGNVKHLVLKSTWCLSPLATMETYTK